MNIHSIARLALSTAMLLLLSCGSDPQTGTSSETQTTLQLLADNSKWLANPVSAPPSTAAAARRSAASDATALWNCPMDSSTHYDSIGRFERIWRGACVETPDTNSKARHKRTWRHNASGSSILDYIESKTPSMWAMDGRGRMRLRGGLDLTIDTFRVVYTETSVSAWYRYQFADRCSFEYRAEAPSVGFSFQLPDGVRSNVECSGRTIGYVIWDHGFGMQVQDLEGHILTTLPRPSVAFSEDSLGVQLVGLFPRSESDPTPVGGKLRLKLLPDEVIPDTAKLWVHEAGGMKIDLTTDQGRLYRNGLFEAEFKSVPNIPWQIVVQAAGWEATSPSITP